MTTIDPTATPEHLSVLRNIVDFNVATIVAYSLNTSEEYNLARLGAWAHRNASGSALVDTTQAAMYLAVRPLYGRRMRQL